MQIRYRNNKNSIFKYRIDEPIWESSDLASPRIFRKWVPSIWKFSDTINCMQHFLQESFSQPFYFIVIIFDSFI